MKHEAIIQDFEDKLKEYTRTAACKRRFVLVEKLLDWLRSSVEPRVSHASRLLHVAYNRRTVPGLPITIEKFQPGNDCCLLVFCILHMIGCGNKIDVFVRRRKIDRVLPLRWDSVQDTFRAAGVENQDLASRFYELQYLFCPAKFEMYGADDWGQEVVIPISEKNPMKKESFAELWQISVPEEFVGPRLRHIASGSRFDNNYGSGGESDWHYEFTLKTFHGVNAAADYTNEVDAFRGLKDHGGMVRWLADYKKAKTSGEILQSGATGHSGHTADNTTYNILLEYGEMDLDEYFGRMVPPALPSDIEAFWRPLFAIADAIDGIHNLKTSDTGIVEEYYGWHADIKPDNILFVERVTMNTTFDGNENSEPVKREKTFKLAAPMFAEFVKKTKKNSGGVPKQRLRGGTETYGAPEYPGRSDNAVSQAIDIWSLGCVFSLAATWIALDYVGLNQFNEIRQLAIIKQAQARLGQAESQNQAVEVSQGDHFHNGHRVLEDVTNWHICLRTVLRNSDSITSQVLDLVDEDMLLGSAEQRINASRLCSRLDLILKSSSQASEPQLPDTIKAVLEEAADVGLIYQPSVMRHSQATGGKGASSYIATVRGTRKSVYERSLKSIHWRASGSKQSSRGYDVNYLENEDSSSGPVAEPPVMSPSTFPPPRKATTHDRISSDFNIRTIPTYRSRQGTLKKQIPMNVFQAREAIERRKEGFKLFHRNKHEETKDNWLLTSYFRGNRNVIFLVDNAESMEANWYEATYLLETLVEMVEGLDEDGMDIRFTTGTVKLEGRDSATKFVNSMKKAYPIRGTRTDLRSSLGDVLDDYENKLRERTMRPSIEVKDIVLIILTDGIWAGLDDKQLVAEKLKEFQKESKTIHNSLKLRPFSVEFIRFGNDDEATKRMIYLDDYLHKEGVPWVLPPPASTMKSRKAANQDQGA